MAANQELRMSVERVLSIDGCVVIRPIGPIDSFNMMSFRKQVLRVIEEGNCRLVFDMAEVPYMASMPFAECVMFLKKAKERNGNMAMANLQPKVREVVQLLGFTLFLNAMESLEEALEFVAIRSEAAPSFPKIFSCPICGHRMRAARSGWFRCSECKTLLKIDPAGRVLPSYSPVENDFDLIPEKTATAIRLLGDLSQIVRKEALDQRLKACFKKIIGQIVVNLYQREVKDVWAELEEVRG